MVRQHNHLLRLLHIVSLVGSIGASSLVMQRQALWLQAIERRIAATTAMLSSMKGVKMCGLTDVLREDLHSLRIEELNISKKFRKLLIWTMGISYISPVVSPILTFAVFSILAAKSDGHTTLDTAKVFTSLSLFTLLSEPLGSLIMALAAFMGGVGSYQRIQEFLVSKPTPERRKFPFLRTSISSASDVGYDSDKDSKASHKSRYSLEITEMGSSDAIVIENGYFGWDEEKQPMGWMQGIDVTVPRAKVLSSTTRTTCTDFSN